MAMQWHHIQITCKGINDNGYDQNFAVWVEAYGREAAVAKAMLDGHVWSDSELVQIKVLETRADKPVAL